MSEEQGVVMGERHVVLVSCSKSKVKELGRIHAIDLYNSPLFKAGVRYARWRASDDHWWILSAKYGLVTPYQMIENYNQALSKRQIARQIWAAGVLSSLQSHYVMGEEICFHLVAGQKYRDPLGRWLAGISGWRIEEPLAHIQGIQAQIAWLDAATKALQKEIVDHGRTGQTVT